jgi:hypothetical protein
MEDLAGFVSLVVSCLNVQARKDTAWFLIMKLTWALHLSENPQMVRHFFQVELRKNSIHQIKALCFTHESSRQIGQACIKHGLRMGPNGLTHGRHLRQLILAEKRHLA